MRRLLMFLTVAALAVGGTASPAAAIAHGEDVPDGEHRFSVRLTMLGLPAAGGGTRDGSCSGALIAPTWVITAGHCFRDEDGERVSRPVAERTTATVGRADLNGSGGVEVEVVRVRQSDTADVALAELASPVTGIAPLRIGTTPPARGEKVRLTGYGRTEAGGDPSARLRTGAFAVEASGDSLVEIAGRAPRRDTSPCPNDSGGPYFREGKGGPELMAVVSSGPGCPHPGVDFAARTDNLTGWITATTDGSSSWAGDLLPDDLVGAAHPGGVVVLLLTVPLAAFGVLVARGRSRHRR